MITILIKVVDIEREQIVTCSLVDSLYFKV